MLGREAQTTGAFRLKALVMCLEAHGGRHAAQAMLARLKTGSIFEDETQPISVGLWVRALHVFESLGGRSGFDHLHRYVIHQANLAAWSQLLRGASGPTEVYSALGTTVTEASRIFLWSTVEVRRGTWVGEIEFAEDFDAEVRWLLQAALQAELSAVPRLFGRAPAQTACLGWSGRRVRFSARWKAAPQVLSPAALWSGLAGMCAGALGAYPVNPQPWVIAGAAVTVGGVIFATMLMVGRDAQHRAAAVSQKYRILALERESSLNRLSASEVSRPHEEPIIASQYRVGQQLGVGAAGAVWEGERLTDGRSVAIKLLRTAVASDGRATDRLRREAEALGLAWHPSVVEVYDQGLLPSGVAFLVMERLYGQTLAERLQDTGVLTVRETVRWGIQAAEALYAVHSAGVVHRDIKPGNIFLHEHQGDTIVKIFDFGVAQVSWAETRLTRSETSIGTRGYAAPEQEAGEEVDLRADIYSLGVTLIECLTGEPPAPRSTARPTRTPRQPVELEGELGAVLAKMIERDPANRYSSARAVREALEGLADLRVTPVPSSPHVA